jgi:hypothetical protein
MLEKHFSISIAPVQNRGGSLVWHMAQCNVYETVYSIMIAIHNKYIVTVKKHVSANGHLNYSMMNISLDSTLFPNP